MFWSSITVSIAVIDLSGFSLVASSCIGFKIEGFCNFESSWKNNHQTWNRTVFIFTEFRVLSVSEELTESFLENTIC